MSARTRHVGAFTGLLAGACAMSLAPAALAQSAPDRSGSRCIQAGWIDHTQVLDDQNILFFLRNGEVLRNTLPARCFGLRMSTRGFTYVALNNEVCGNLQSIRNNETHAVCMLGPFTSEPTKR